MEAPVSSHDLGVAAAVGLVRALGELPKSLVLVALEIDEHHEPETLSPTVARRLPALIDALSAELNRLQRPAGHGSKPTRHKPDNGGWATRLMDDPDHAR